MPPDSHTLYRGSVFHQRLSPKKHTFSYPATFFHFNIGRLESLSKRTIFFGYNRKRLLEIRDTDYLRGEDDPILTQLEEFLSREQAGEHSLLFTSPRYLGMAFNPVNFYFRLSSSDKLIEALVEVNNTFGDRHIYPLKHLIQTSEGTYSATTEKAFHVSPFNPIAGEYQFRFVLKPRSIFLGIDLYENGQCIMKTYLEGQSHELSPRKLIQYCLLHPLDTAVNAMPRILYQASVLYFKKKLRIYPRPEQRSKNTLINDSKETDVNARL